MTYTIFSCAQNFRAVALVLILTVIKDTNSFPSQSESGKILQNEDYPFDFMYDWINRNSISSVPEIEPFSSLPTAPGSFINKNDDISSPFESFDIEAPRKEWRQINDLFERNPGHSDVQIISNKRGELRKTCLQGHRFRPWLKNLCNKL